MGASSLREREMLHRRRDEAIKLYKEGMSQINIAKRFGVSRNAVSLWIREHENGTLHEGMSPTKEQLEKIVKMLNKPPVHYGIAGTFWSWRCIADLVGKKLGMKYTSIGLRNLFENRGVSFNRKEINAE